MRSTPLVLLALAIVCLSVVAYRIMTGGPPGPKTFSVAALGVALLVAWFLARRRAAVTTTTTTTGTTGPADTTRRV